MAVIKFTGSAEMVTRAPMRHTWTMVVMLDLCYIVYGAAPAEMGASDAVSVKSLARSRFKTAWILLQSTL